VGRLERRRRSRDIKELGDKPEPHNEEGTVYDQKADWPKGFIKGRRGGTVEEADESSRRRQERCITTIPLFATSLKEKGSFEEICLSSVGVAAKIGC